MPAFHSLFDDDKSKLPNLSGVRLRREKVVDSAGKKKITEEMSSQEISKIVSEEVAEIIKKELSKKS